MKNGLKPRSLLRWSVAVGLITFAIGILAALSPARVPLDPNKALPWFIMSFLAMLVPYVKEVAFQDLKLVLWEYQHTTEKLLQGKITVQALTANVNLSRVELVHSFFELRKYIGEEEWQRRVRRLSGLYLQELQVDVPTVKRMLAKAGVLTKNETPEMDADYFASLAVFQQQAGLEPDGICGYLTYNALLQRTK